MHTPYSCANRRAQNRRGALTARWAAQAALSLTALLVTAGDLDLTPLGGWPESSLIGTPLALANGKTLLSGNHRGVPALLAVEPGGPDPFQVLGSLPLRDFNRIEVAGPLAVVTDFNSRLFVVDVTEPSSLKFKGMTLTPSGNNYIPDPLAVSGTYAYVVRSVFSSDQPDTSPAQIAVVDFSDPTNPRIVGEQSLPVRPAAYFSLHAAAADDSLLCVASFSGADGSGKFALDVFDLSNPEAPRWVGKHEATGEGLHALTVVGRRAYWAPWTIPTVGRQSKVQVVDLSDLAAPKLMGTYTTSGEAMNLAANERYVYLAKEVLSGDLYRIAVDIVDVGDPTAPKRVGGFTGATADGAPTIAIEGGMALVGSWTGVASYDVSDPTVMRRLAARGADHSTSDVTVAGSRAYAVGGSTMNILDISQPGAPQRLGTYKTANGILNWQVAVAGNHAYLATDSLGLQTIDVSDPAAPRRTSVFRGSSQFATVAVEGNLLVAAGYDGLFFLDLADPAKPALRGQASVRYPDFREKSVAISGHHVFVTSSDRSSKTGVMEVFDANDPASPQYVGAYEVPAVARDVAVSGDLAVVTSYVPDGGIGFADILDISDLANPVRLALHTVIPGGPDIAKVSLVGPYAILGGPQVLDLTDPTKPRQVAELSGLAGNATISGDVLLAAAYGQGLRSFRMSPATLSRSRTLDVGGQALGVALQRDVAWMALGTAGLQAVDRTKPDATALLGNLPLDGKAWDVVIAGNRAVVAAGEAGLVIVDTTDPANPQPLGALDTPGEAREVAVSGNTACVADFGEGVRVVDLSNPASPRELGRFATPGYALGVAWHGPHALVACREAGLQVLDLADPAQPKLAGRYLVRGAVEALTVAGDRAFIADGVDGFLVLDVSDPAKPKRLGLAPGTTRARSIAVAGRFAYVADVARGIRVYDIGDPTRPKEVGGTAAVNTYQLAVAGDRLLAAAGSSGLVEFEFFTAPLELGISRAGNTVRLTWPSSAIGFGLESSNALTPMADWLPVSTTPEIVGDQNAVTLDIGPGSRFFRLKKP